MLIRTPVASGVPGLACWTEAGKMAEEFEEDPEEGKVYAAKKKKKKSTKEKNSKEKNSAKEKLALK